MGIKVKFYWDRKIEKYLKLSRGNVCVSETIGLRTRFKSWADLIKSEIIPLMQLKSRYIFFAI